MTNKDHKVIPSYVKTEILKFSAIRINLQEKPIFYQYYRHIRILANRKITKFEDKHYHRLLY